MSEKKMIYVVMGQTGEYSDRSEWPVAAFTTDAAAAERVSQMDAFLREHKIHMDDEHTQFFVAPSFDDRRELKTPLDPEFNVDYTGTRYYIMPVRFES